MNLLYFSRRYTTHDRRFLESLSAAACRVSYLRLHSEDLDLRALPSGVVSIPCVAASSHGANYWTVYRRLRRVLAEVKPQVMIAGPVQTAALLGALTGYSPLLTMSWGSDLLVEADRSRAMRAATRFVLRRSAGVLGDCQAVRDAVTRFASMPEDRIVTFPWGVDPQTFSPRVSELPLRQELGWVQNPILISTRNWEPIYSVQTVVEAFALLRQLHPETRLLLLGDGSQRARIMDLIHRLGLANFIHTPGRVSNDLLPEYLRLANLYVTAALSDGTSVSLLEAMACGLPVVVTKGYGNLEWVTPQQNGWLVEPGNPEILAKTLDEALTNPARLRVLGNANRSAVLDRADWKRNFPKLLGLLERLSQPPFQPGQLCRRRLFPTEVQ